MQEAPTIEEILSKNPGVDPKKLREFLDFQQLVGNVRPRQGSVLPQTRRRLLVGDPDNDDSRTVRLRYSR